MYLFFIFNGFMFGLCSGRKFALLTAGPFDVLLQSLPIVVSSHLICSHLSPIPPSLSPYMPSAFLELLCLSHGEFIHTLTYTRLFKITAREAMLLCCYIFNNKSHFSFNFVPLQLYQPHTFSGTRGFLASQDFKSMFRKLSNISTAGSSSSPSCHFLT